MHRLFFILISLIATNGFAADVANLYQSQLPVSSQSEEDRIQVAPNILQQVILKVVGDRAALDAVDITPILLQTDQLTQQYQYRRINKVSDDLTEPDQLEVLLTFNETSLDQSLTNVGLPIWGKSRPEVLLWLAIDNGKKRTIVGADSEDSDIPAAIKRAADMRGLPILMPLMDLQDQGKVKFADLWAGFSESVLQASTRYAAQVVLMARVSVANNGAIEVRWQSLINGETEQWQSRGDLDQALQSGIDELTDRLARRFTQVITSRYGQHYSLQISNVRDYADYSRVMNYLSKVQYVSNVQISSLIADQIDISISLKGDLDVLNRTLAIDRVLAEDNLYDPDKMSYRLLP
ncbi:MAG: hypothetical protein DRQ39_07930 [Gammaproteobacteria bacterium]|nr:MAG: hypothetical protein DRQ39_07930 [Gammaproteobacteria bacterium]RKZ94381.1 MAG: hypothetical protein DRQ40_05960 [Gammaproteobacteria bacterium]